MPILRLRLLWLGAILILLYAARPVSAQTVSITPTEIYPGENVITVSAFGGIRSVRVVPSDAASRAYITTRNTGNLSGCPSSHNVELTVGAASLPISAMLYVEMCNGRVDSQLLGINTTWNLDEVPFPDAEVGEEVCRPFHIQLTGFGAASVTLDSVSSPQPGVSFDFSFAPPLPIPSGSTYRYTVCFTADKPGIYRFPVITWIRRSQPAGGHTSYPVADTGLIRVLPKRNTIGITEVPLDTVGADNPQPVTDPTTFRSVAIPNAVRPPRGRFFVGSYDLLGLVAGYAVADELLLFAGGAPPLPDDWGGVNGDMFGAFGVGAKLGTTFFDKLDIAVGYTYGQSLLDKEATAGELDSRITVHVPFGAISYGTDDARVSATGGYAFKTHSTWITTDPVLPPLRDTYAKDAAFGSVGGDYRFARHWKVAGEFLMMQTVDVAPIVLTARYFTNTFALDIGAAYAGITLNDAPKPKIPLLPVVSAVFVF